MAAAHADPVRLKLLNAAFRLAQDECYRRAGVVAPTAKRRAPERSDARDEEIAEAARLNAALSAHMSTIPREELTLLHRRIARQLLLEIDRKLAGPGTPPGERLDLTVLSAATCASDDQLRAARVGLVSLPWMSPAMPSIQLATLAASLERHGIESDVHELYVDFATRIGLNLYNHLGNLLGFVPEWVFSRHYYRPECGDDLMGMVDQRPLTEYRWPEFADSVLEALDPIAREYLDDMLAQVDWARYDVIGCSLTISQLGSSMAFARRVKLEHPSVKIVFGGSQCAGVMGRAILRICPYVDVVVHVEGELVLPQLVEALRRGSSPSQLRGISYRTADGEIVTNEGADLYQPDEDKLALDYDAYFRRLGRLGVLDKMTPWLPFESSRGCWYGQKVQCTFCGLHEIMKFRGWSGDAVLAELERLKQRYGIGRFYCMDLILPREYLRTMLPEVARRGHEWMFFYEIKANVKRRELQLLADAGVRWVQPGIESLDSDLLRLMHKGVTAAQNIILLKWSRELDVFCGWNLLFGLPGENAASYERMAELIPKLVHLQPPSGGGQFQLHRFSPYFDHPEQHGIRWTGAHPMFRYAFPVSQEDLDDLVYLHEFEFVGDNRRAVDTATVEAAVAAWGRAFRHGARLDVTQLDDGSSRIVDHRDTARPAIVHELSPPEAALYLYLDGGIADKRLAESFERDAGEAFAALGGEEGVRRVLDRWIEHDLLVAIDGKLVALAVRVARRQTDVVHAAEEATVAVL